MQQIELFNLIHKVLLIQNIAPDSLIKLLVWYTFYVIFDSINTSVRLYEITAVEYFIDMFDRSILTQEGTKYILHSVGT